MEDKEKMGEGLELGSGGGGFESPRPDQVVEIGGMEPNDKVDVGMGWGWRRLIVSRMDCWKVAN